MGAVLLGIVLVLAMWAHKREMAKKKKKRYGG